MMKKYPQLEEAIYFGDFAFDGLGHIAEPSPTSKNIRSYTDDDRGVYLYQANCLELMDAIAVKHPQGCFDMIFADPPYFLSNGGFTCKSGQMANVYKGDWDKSRGPEGNHQFNIEWLGRCQKLLKPNGTIWVSGTMHAIYSIGFAMQKLGFKVLNDIVWEKPNPPPNLACRYFTHSTETILWAAKSTKSRHVFNYEDMKRNNDGKQMKSVWRLPPPAKDEKKFGKHPTQKPISLVERCILSSTHQNNFVFDPFSGSSTTGVAAINTGRRFCGVELEMEFINLSISRLQAATEKKQTKP